jgi:hypothetical protein
MEEIVAPGVEFPAGGHARHAPGVTVVEGDRSFGQPVEIRREHPVTAIRGQHSAVKRIEHYHYGLHVLFLSPAKSSCRLVSFSQTILSGKARASEKFSGHKRRLQGTWPRLNFYKF